METALPLERLEEMGDHMDPRVLRHIHEGQSEAFEGFEGFDLIAYVMDEPVSYTHLTLPTIA